jgi:hypothetical protein
MITLHEAYLKAKSKEEKSGRTRLIDCRDYGEFWGFGFVPPIDESLLKELNGGADITINKKTGEIRYFNVAMDIDLAKKAIPIPIERFAEYSVAI